MPTELTIKDVRRLPSANPKRMGKYDRLVVYEVAPGQAYVITAPDEDFTEAKLAEAIKTDLAERGEWVGKKITV